MSRRGEALSVILAVLFVALASPLALSITNRTVHMTDLIVEVSLYPGFNDRGDHEERTLEVKAVLEGDPVSAVTVVLPKGHLNSNLSRPGEKRLFLKKRDDGPYLPILVEDKREFPVFSATAKCSQPRAAVDDSDDAETSDLSGVDEKEMAEIVKLMLERALIAQEIPDYHLIKDKDTIILSTENIDPLWVPRLFRPKLILLSPEQIQEKANHEGDFLYLCFSEIKIVRDSKVFISLDNIWAMSKDSPAIYLSGGGFTVKYLRESGRWIGKIISSWIS